MPDEIVERLCERRKLRYMGNCKCGKCQLVPMDLLDDAICELRRLRAASPSEVRKHDGRNIADSAPHAAYCDIALQDAQIEVVDNGERLWMYDDALFDKSLAGNGYKVVPVGELPSEVMEAALQIVTEVDQARAKGRESFVSDNAETVARFILVLATED